MTLAELEIFKPLSPTAIQKIGDDSFMNSVSVYTRNSELIF